jgi:hypothetical protein
VRNKKIHPTCLLLGKKKLENKIHPGLATIPNFVLWYSKIEKIARG